MVTGLSITLNPWESVGDWKVSYDAPHPNNHNHDQCFCEVIEVAMDDWTAQIDWSYWSSHDWSSYRQLEKPWTIEVAMDNWSRVTIFLILFCLPMSFLEVSQSGSALTHFSLTHIWLWKDQLQFYQVFTGFYLF